MDDFTKNMYEEMYKSLLLNCYDSIGLSKWSGEDLPELQKIYDGWYIGDKQIPEVTYNIKKLNKEVPVLYQVHKVNKENARKIRDIEEKIASKTNQIPYPK